MKKRNKILHSRSAFALAVFCFIFLVSNHHPIKFLQDFKYTHLHALVTFAPCIIFGFTVDAYYHFVTRYRGKVSGMSLVFLLLALLFCLGLVPEQESGDWWTHLRYIYLLFLSFVCWDVVMIEVLLRPINCAGEDEDLVKRDMHEVKLVSYFINMPTLLTIMCISYFAACCIEKGGVEEKIVTTFVAGVISFHLIFSSAAYVFVRLQAQDS